MGGAVHLLQAADATARGINRDGALSIKAKAESNYSVEKTRRIVCRENLCIDDGRLGGAIACLRTGGGLSGGFHHLLHLFEFGVQGIEDNDCLLEDGVDSL